MLILPKDKRKQRKPIHLVYPKHVEEKYNEEDELYDKMFQINNKNDNQ